jgi:hypothetical protein
MKKCQKKNNRFLWLNSLMKIFIVSFCCLFIIINIISIVSAAGIGSAFSPLDGKYDPLDTVANEARYDVRTKETGKTRAFDFISPIVANITQAGLSFLGVFFMLLMIYGGYLWMSDTGNEEQVKKARGIVVGAAIGLIIVISAYAISIFVVESFSEVTIDSPAVNTEE